MLDPLYIHLFWWQGSLITWLRKKHYRIVLMRRVLFHGESYMSAHILLDLSNELGERDQMRGLPSIFFFFATS